MKKVLIFGISGFVGKYLADEFLQHDYEVFGSGLNKNSELSDKVNFFSADIIDEDVVKSIVKEVAPDMIVNLAAMSSVGESWKIPQKTMLVNVNGALNILEASKLLDSKPKILFIGSSEEYVISDYPMSEDRQLNASNPYGISKVTQEQFAKVYREQYGMNIFCVRAFNHTGVGQRDSFVLPSFCKQVVEIEKTGRPGVIKVGNLSIKRDFSHVKDVARAYRMILESENSNVIYNVGYGKAYKLEDMLNHIVKLSNAEITIEIDPSRFRPIDQPVICCDHSLITSQIGWKPKYSVFDALEEMIDYYRQKERG